MRYRLKDNYSRFYLHHIAPHAKAIAADLFRYGSLSTLKGWDAIKGLQFENLVVSNFKTLLPILGIDGATLVSASPYRRAKSKTQSGVQVDLLLQTKTTAYVIEMKRHEHIGEEVAREVNAKVDAVGFHPGVATRTVLVYDGKLASAVRTDHMLDFVIPAERLFG